MVYLVNIENQMVLEKTQELFTVLQSMWKGMLYCFDIQNRIMYRSDQISNHFGLPKAGENYPDLEDLKKIMHPDDIEEYVAFIDSVAQGQEGSLDSRIKTEHGEFEYHNMTFKALPNQDGTVTEMIGVGQNIHDLRQTEEKLDIISQYFSAIQDLSDDMLYRVDLESKTLYRTTEQAKNFGIDGIMSPYPQAIIDSSIIHPDDEKIYAQYGEKLLSGKASQVEIRMKSSDGVYGYRRLTCTPVFDGTGKVREMFGKIVNIQMVRELEEQANYDALTKLLNKRAMLESTTSILQKATKTDRHALFFMDLDDFKYVNDNLGHAFGDFLLAELGKRLSDSVRVQDLVGRVGGDEFVVFLRDVQTIDIAMGKAKMLLSTISEDFFDGTTRHTMHGSLGIAMFPDHGATYEELYHHADLALYRSKHKGKNLVTLFTEELRE